MGVPANEKAFLTQNIGLPQGNTFQNADGTGKKTIFTASTNGSILYGIVITSDDTVARDLLLYVNDGSTDYTLGHVDIPIGAGTNGTANAVAGLNQTNLPYIRKDADGNPFIKLKAGTFLKGAMLVAVTAAKIINVTILSEEL